MIDDDLTEALRPGGSPVKAAQEVLRILRDQLRSVIEFGGLSLDSYVEFQSNVRGRINRLEAGVPPMRSSNCWGCSTPEWCASRSDLTRSWPPAPTASA